MPGRHYTEDERQAGFVAIVLAHDNCSKASRDLKAAGIEIPIQRGAATRPVAAFPHQIPDPSRIRRAQLVPDSTFALLGGAGWGRALFAAVLQSEDG